jgi:very-short-patch-repair endonuclease
MESVVRWLIHEAGLPAPVLQYVITDARGRFVAQVDFAWPERKVLVEFDGDVHREREVFVDDRRRQNRIVAEAWTVLRFSGADVYGRPDDVVGEIGAAVVG